MELAVLVFLMLAFLLTSDPFALFIVWAFIVGSPFVLLGLWRSEAAAGTSNLKPKVLLDGVVISLLKQQLPAFYAVDISSLNKRFHLTKFEKPTVCMNLGMSIGDGDEFVDIGLWDQSKTVGDSFKKRTLTVPVADLVEMLASLTGQGIIGIFGTFAALDIVPVLNALLQLENDFSPSGLFMAVPDDCPQKLFAAVIRRFANKLHRATFDFGPLRLALEDGGADAEMDWRQLDDYLRPLTNLKKLRIGTGGAMPPSDWLKNLLQANSAQLKLFDFNCCQLSAPMITEAASTVAKVPVIRISFCASEIAEHVDADLCRQGPCTLTMIALHMPKTSTLKLVIVELSRDGDDFFCGDALRLAYYLLSLAKTGSRVVVQARFVAVERMAQFLDDLRHYHPKMSLTWRSDGNSVACISASRHRRWHYMVRLGSVKLYLLDQEVFFHH